MPQMLEIKSFQIYYVFDCNRPIATLCLQITTLLKLNYLFLISSFFIQQEKMLSAILFSTEEGWFRLFIYLYNSSRKLYHDVFQKKDNKEHIHWHSKGRFYWRTNLKFGRHFLVIIYIYCEIHLTRKLVTWKIG